MAAVAALLDTLPTPSDDEMDEVCHQLKFITPSGYFCYVKISFIRKNAGATYQLCIQFCFKEQIGHKLEVYVDDIVIKS
jgi:hypothetical protein